MMMKPGVVLMVMGLCLAPAVALADPVVVDVAYLGHGQFKYDDKDYDYKGLVGAVQAAYAGKHFDVLNVDMGAVASQLDKAQVCPLRQSLQTQVAMFITVDGEKRTLFCN